MNAERGLAGIGGEADYRPIYLTGDFAIFSASHNNTTAGEKSKELSNNNNDNDNNDNIKNCAPHLLVMMTESSLQRGPTGSVVLALANLSSHLTTD